VTGRKAERNHVFLAVMTLLTEFFNSSAKTFEEFGLIYHAEICTVAGAETPRAD